MLFNGISALPMGTVFLAFLTALLCTIERWIPGHADPLPVDSQASGPRPPEYYSR